MEDKGKKGHKRAREGGEGKGEEVETIKVGRQKCVDGNVRHAAGRVPLPVCDMPVRAKMQVHLTQLSACSVYVNV